MTPEEREQEIREGLARVRARIDAACAAAGRTDPVRLVVVTKTFPASDVAILARLGVQDVGENRDQEARAKRADLGEAGDLLDWHMIGQLQRNKAASVAQWADVVESVDRAAIVAPLGRGAVSHGRTLRALVQVALDEPLRDDRGGVPPAEVMEVAALVAAEPGLQLGGLMAVAPWPGGDADAAFARLAGIAAEVQTRWPDATTVSAGMSGDLEEAVRHGATQVRIGGAVLGARDYV